MKDELKMKQKKNMITLLLIYSSVSGNFVVDL